MHYVQLCIASFCSVFCELFNIGMQATKYVLLCGNMCVTVCVLLRIEAQAAVFV